MSPSDFSDFGVLLLKKMAQLTQNTKVHVLNTRKQNHVINVIKKSLAGPKHKPCHDSICARHKENLVCMKLCQKPDQKHFDVSLNKSARSILAKVMKMTTRGTTTTNLLAKQRGLREH